jgi:squalene-hopene/tetraprenyl-beta-curcumene cyclase
LTHDLAPRTADWRRAQAFFDAWVDERSPADRAGRLVVESLLEATYDVAPADPPRRRLAMSTAGSPVVYSHKWSPEGRPPAFRMLAEPGGVGISVAEQIALSRELLDRLLDELGWSGAAAPVNQVLALLIPDDAAAVEDWHGGLGFGVDVGASGPELRLYCNVRDGDLTARWQRMLEVVGEFADARAADAVVEMLDIAVARAVPAGVAVAIADGELRGIRLYAGLVDAGADGAVAAAPQRFAGAAPAIRQLVDSYRSEFGELSEQGLTLAYDFAISEGLLVPWVVRYKVDLFCEPANAAGSALHGWIEERARSLRLAPDSLRRFASGLDRQFPGWTFQYLSLGCRDAGPELTAYCVPGLADNPVARRPVQTPGVVVSIERAIAYLLEQRTAAGCWEDFETLAGPSTDWVSAYVALALARTGDPEAVIAARAAWSRLRGRRGPSGGWGYNGKVPPDADSTSWVTQLAAALGSSVGSEAEQFLTQHLTPGGALATYATASRIAAFTQLPGQSFAGWCGPHTCVTAAAAGLASMPGRERMLDWIRDAQEPDGHWRAYWWDSRHYATTFAAAALDDADAPGDKARVERAVRWTAAEVDRSAPEGGTAFDRALALRALLLAPETLPRANQLVRALLRAQRAGGSWVPSARLRIPPPQLTEPEAYSPWVEGGRGGGSIDVDQHACFTTATILQALCAVSRLAPAPYR